MSIWVTVATDTLGFWRYRYILLDKEYLRSRGIVWLDKRFLRSRGEVGFFDG